MDANSVGEITAPTLVSLQVQVLCLCFMLSAFIFKSTVSYSSLAKRPLQFVLSKLDIVTSDKFDIVSVWSRLLYDDDIDRFFLYISCDILYAVTLLVCFMKQLSVMFSFVLTQLWYHQIIQPPVQVFVVHFNTKHVNLHCILHMV